MSMRWSFVLIAALAGPAWADGDVIAVGDPPPCNLPPQPVEQADDIALPQRGHGFGLDMLTIDIRNGQASAIGANAMLLRGRGRLGAFVEGGAGALISDHPSERVGLYASGRVGGRVLATSFEGGELFRVSLTLDAGLGIDEMWLRGADPFTRPNLFVGWTTLVGGDEHAYVFSLRVAGSRRESDPDVIRAVCGGPCTGIDDAPVDFTIMVSAGVVTW
jgi:hypothetical protein